MKSLLHLYVGHILPLPCDRVEIKPYNKSLFIVKIKTDKLRRFSVNERAADVIRLLSIVKRERGKRKSATMNLI